MSKKEHALDCLYDKAFLDLKKWTILIIHRQII